MWYGEPEWIAGLFIVAFFISLIATFWIFYDIKRKFREAMIYQVITVASTILILPSAMLRIVPCLVSQGGMQYIVAPLAALGILASLAALFALFSYGLGIGIWEYPPTLPTPEPSPPAPVEAVPPTEPIVLPGHEVPPLLVSAETISLRRPPPRLAWLVVMSGPLMGKEFRLGEVTTIGRDAALNDVVIDDPYMSRQHAKIRLENETFVIYDLASLCGTFVNGERIQKRALVDGDTIIMGRTTFAFMEVREKTKEKGEE